MKTVGKNKNFIPPIAPYLMRIVSDIDMNKIEAYRQLVEKRKACSLCEGLCNPAVVNSRYDSDQIGPWSLWQGNLDASLMVVGQDWGGTSYFQKWEGRDQPSGNPTNENLQNLLKRVGIEIGKPRDQQGQVLFLTNLILCLRMGGLQAKIPDRKQCFKNCSRIFFKPLMEIIRPKVIIAMGLEVSKSILALYDIPYSKSAKLSELMSQSPYQLTSSIKLFPVYHCGVHGQNINRRGLQIEDWMRIRPFV